MMKTEKMIRWMVCDSRTEFLGFVYADCYTNAWVEARNRYRRADYIQEC